MRIAPLSSHPVPEAHESVISHALDASPEQSKDFVTTAAGASTSRRPVYPQGPIAPKASTEFSWIVASLADAEHALACGKTTSQFIHDQEIKLASLPPESSQANWERTQLRELQSLSRRAPLRVVVERKQLQFQDAYFEDDLKPPVPATHDGGDAYDALRMQLLSLKNTPNVNPHERSALPDEPPNIIEPVSPGELSAASSSPRRDRHWRRSDIFQARRSRCKAKIYPHSDGDLYHSPESDGLLFHMRQPPGDTNCGYYAANSALHALGAPTLSLGDFLQTNHTTRREFLAASGCGPSHRDEYDSYVGADELTLFLNTHASKHGFADGPAFTATTVNAPEELIYAKSLRSVESVPWRKQQYDAIINAKALLILSHAHWTTLARNNNCQWPLIDSQNPRSQRHIFYGSDGLEVLTEFHLKHKRVANLIALS